MDKLEKAMEKARRQREAAIGTSFQQNAIKAQPAYTHRPQPVAAAGAASNIVPVVDDHLQRNRILAHQMRSPEADIFRILRTQVLQIMNKSGFKTLAITSPRYGDGKSTIALNLALSIALDLKQTVLLADLDLRKPNLNQYLGLENGLGLTDYLLDDTPLADCMERLSFDRLSILPCGTPMDNSSEVLGSPKMAALAHELKSRYHDRFVIYDMPPVLAQDDSIAFLPHVDAVLVIVRDEITRIEDLKTCLTRLSNANVIGTVLNNSRQG